MASEPYFVLTLPLKPDIRQQHILEKRFAVNGWIYNALLQKAGKRYRQMAQTKAFRRIREALATESDKAVRKELLQERDTLIAQYGLTRAAICRDATGYRRYYKAHTDSPVAQNLAADVWKAVDALVQGRAERVHPKKELRSLSGKTNQTSIKYRNGEILWKDLVLPVGRKGNAYETAALKKELRFCRIKQEEIRGKKRYFAELVLKGTPPQKHAEESPDETVGLALGFRKIAAVSRKEACLHELPEKSRRLEQEKQKLQAYMERSRRAQNPANYEPDGRVRKGSREWRISRNYQKAGRRYRELCRKQRAWQKQEQFELVRKIAAAGTTFYIEDINFAKLRRRKPNGAYAQMRSPVGFRTILEQKLMQQGKELIYVQPFLLKATGFNHHTGTYQRMPLRKSWRVVDGQRVDKKLYSAFLLNHVAEDLKQFDLNACERDFSAFVELQTEYLQKAG